MPSSARVADERWSRRASPSPSLLGTPGLIDSGYRGELRVLLVNTDPAADYQVHRGDRIAQLVVQRVEEVAWQVVDQLDGHDRGGGFGHSGR